MASKRLAALQWRLPIGQNGELESASFRVPSLAAVAEIQKVWAPLRAHESHQHWDWNLIAKGSEELFAMCDGSAKILGLIASKKRRVRLPDGTYYRLDFIESDPNLAGRGLGGPLVAAAAIRALELKSDGMLLGSLRETAHIYKGLGFSPELKPGWNLPPDLTAFVGSVEVLFILEESANEWSARETKAGEEDG